MDAPTSTSRAEGPVRVRWLDLVWLAGPLLAFLLAYVPDVGHGFIRDDFRWLEDARAVTAHGPGHAFRQDSGFYRPIVTLTFVANDLACGTSTRCFGLTNVVLALACAAAIATLLWTLGTSGPMAAAVGALWLLNPHGINMAVLWISGRTALCLTLFSVAAATAALRGRMALSAALCLLALLSKEEAVVLPFVIGIGLWLERPAALARTWVYAVALAVYALLRSATGAMTPATAPPFYRFTFDAPTVMRNVVEYADRSLTWALAALAVAVLVAWRKPQIPSSRRRLVLFGVVWLAGGFALTAFLPVRSSLYAVLASVGAAIALAAVARSLVDLGGRNASRRLAVAVAVVPLLAVPLLRSRNVRWVRPADVSAAVLDQVRDLAPRLPPDHTLVAHDAVGTRSSLQGAFGTLFPQAFSMAAGRPMKVWVVPPPRGVTDAHLSMPAGPAAHFWLRGGRLVDVNGR